VQVELIDKRLLDLLVQDQEAVGVDLASAKFHGARHVAVDVDGFAVIAVAREIRDVMLAVEILSFLCGASGWQNCSGIAPSPL